MTRITLSRKPLESSINNFVDELFNDMPGVFHKDLNKAGRSQSIPVNVKESDSSYTLEMAVPGFEKKEFAIQVEADILTVTGTKEVTTEEKGKDGKVIRNEFSARSFKRSFTLDEKIDATKIEASYVNGVLVLNLPKKEEVKVSPKAIEIK
jgi:HSP20 family protein